MAEHKHSFKAGDIVLYRELEWEIEAELGDLDRHYDRWPIRRWHYIRALGYSFQDQWHERAPASLLIDRLSPHPDPDAFWAGYAKAVLLDQLIVN